jgi:hypothetical protein
LPRPVAERRDMSTSSATDAANAGLGVPEAPLPTWDEALAHAEVLREQGVKVRIDERYRVIEIRGDNGKRHDPADGTPAWQGFYPSGTTEWISHYANGRLHDPADGTPAAQWLYPDGSPSVVDHYANGELHDPADGTPAAQWFYPDGTPKVVERYTNGKRVSGERFPPPTGEV